MAETVFNVTVFFVAAILWAAFGALLLWRQGDLSDLWNTFRSQHWLLQGIEFLNEKNSGRKTILIFSDLKEDLEKGYVRDVPLELEGFEVVALNVTKLRSDNYDPREYLVRVDTWRQRIEKAGGRWRMINDLERLDGLL